MTHWANPGTALSRSVWGGIAAVALVFVAGCGSDKANQDFPEATAIRQEPESSAIAGSEGSTSPELVSAEALHDAISGFISQEVASTFASCPFDGTGQYFGEYLPSELRGAQDFSAPEVRLSNGPDGESFMVCENNRFGVGFGILDVSRLEAEMVGATVSDFRGGVLRVECSPDDLCEALWMKGDATVYVSFDNGSSESLGGPWDAEVWLKPRSTDACGVR